DGIRDWSVTGVQTCALPISALAPVCGICGISIGVPGVLNSDSFSRLPAVGCWASAADAAQARDATENGDFFMASSLSMDATGHRRWSNQVPCVQTDPADARATPHACA